MVWGNSKHPPTEWSQPELEASKCATGVCAISQAIERPSGAKNKSWRAESMEEKDLGRAGHYPSIFSPLCRVSPWRKNKALLSPPHFCGLSSAFPRRPHGSSGFCTDFRRPGQKSQTQKEKRRRKRERQRQRRSWEERHTETCWRYPRTDIPVASPLSRTWWT